MIMTQFRINEILGEMAPRVLKLLKDGSSRSAPLTLRNVCELGGLVQKEESWVQQSLLHLIRTEKHVHRYRESRSRHIKGAQAYKYWYDVQTINAEFGSVPKKRKQKKLFDVPASLPIPAPVARRAVQVVDLMEFNLNSGTLVRLSVADINDLHKRLKLIFG